MAWTAPATVTAGQLMTAAFWNTHVRDNLLVTAPGIASTAGGIFAATGANAIAERIPAADYVVTNGNTASTSYTDLASAGPAVSIVTGTKAIVLISVRTSNNTLSAASHAAVAVTGATTIAAADQVSTFTAGPTTQIIGSTRLVTYGLGGHHGALTGGTNVFTMKYRVPTGTGQWDQRGMMVFPL